MHPTATRHAFTHFVLELVLAEARTDHADPPDEASGEIWCQPAELDRLALPTVMTKLLRVARITALDPVRARSEGVGFAGGERCSESLPAHRLPSCGSGGCCT
jgi:NUDIX domain